MSTTSTGTTTTTSTPTNYTDSAVKSFPNLTQLVGEIEAPIFRDPEFIAKVQESKRAVITQALAQIEADPVTLGKTKDLLMKDVFANLEQETIKMYVLELMAVQSIKDYLSSQWADFLRSRGDDFVDDDDDDVSLKNFIEFAIENKKSEFGGGDGRDGRGGGGGGDISKIVQGIVVDSATSPITPPLAPALAPALAPEQPILSQADISKTIQKLIVPLGTGVNQFNMNTEIYKTVYGDPLMEFMASDEMKIYMNQLFESIRGEMASILGKIMLPENLQWLLLKTAVDKWKSAPEIEGESLDYWLGNQMVSSSGQSESVLFDNKTGNLFADKSGGKRIHATTLRRRRRRRCKTQKRTRKNKNKN